MKKVLFSVLSFAFLNLNAQNSPLNLIPQPVEVIQTNGIFTLTKATTIAFNKAEASTVVEMLVQKLNVPTGLMLKAQEGKTGLIQLNLNDSPNAQLGKEGYVFESTPKGVIISANQTAGLFYGIQTLLQLLPKEIESKSLAKANWVIPAVKIIDYPRFAWSEKIH
jgi:hexosaminidase